MTCKNCNCDQSLALQERLEQAEKALVETLRERDEMHGRAAQYRLIADSLRTELKEARRERDEMRKSAEKIALILAVYGSDCRACPLISMCSRSAPGRECVNPILQWVREDT